MDRLRQIIIISVLGLVGCSSIGEDSPLRQEVPEEFYLAPGNQDGDDGCIDICGEETVFGACDFTRGGDVLAFIKVESVDKEYLSCEDRPYSASHATMEIQVLDVIAGEESFATVTEFKGWHHDRFEPGKIYFVIAMEVDSMWWRNNYFEVVAGTETEFLTEPSQNGDVTVFDLPQDREEFIAELRGAWENYGEVCEPRQVRPQLSEQERKSIIYEKPCLEYPGSGDDLEANQDDS